MRISVFVLTTVLLLRFASAQTACPTFTAVSPIEIPRISQSDRIFRFDGGFVAVIHDMAVDTDGSAYAYHPHDLGTSYLCDGLDPYDETTHKCDSDKTSGSRCFTEVSEAIHADWAPSRSGPFCTYGFEAPGLSAKGTSNKVWGKDFGTGPIPVQSATDPAPGFFISTTGLSDPNHPEKSQRHYIAADTIPYVVVPSRLVGSGKDFSWHPTPAWAWNLKTGYESPAIVGDTQRHFGEGSVALVQILQENAITPITVGQVLGTSITALPFPYVKKKSGAVRAVSGATGTVIFVYFTKTPAVRDLSTQGLTQAVGTAFRPLGGEPFFKDCLKPLSGAH